jgi:hypothetical protein
MERYVIKVDGLYLNTRTSKWSTSIDDATYFVSSAQAIQDAPNDLRTFEIQMVFVK